MGRRRGKERDRFKAAMPVSRGGKMVVVAGLPPTTHTRAISFLKNRFPTWEVRGVASTASDGRGLYPATKCNDLAIDVSEFAVRRRKGKATPISPHSIILLYVSAPDSASLLEVFDFTVMAEPLAGLHTWSEKGAQLRHSNEAVEGALINALAANGRARTALNQVAERLNRAADGEPLLLPPRSFKTLAGDLGAEFMTFRNGTRPWSDRLTHLGPSPLTHENIDHIPEDQTRRAFVDNRKIGYLVAHPKAYHAVVRELGEHSPADVRIHQLRSMYRFGASLPSGFHHDAAYTNGTSFLRTDFVCSVDGDCEVTGAYANIYPDDYIRVTKGSKRAPK